MNYIDTGAIGSGLPTYADRLGPSEIALAGRATLIADIQLAHRERMFAMNQRKRIDQALDAYFRLQLGYHTGLPKAQREKIIKAAGVMMKDETHRHVIAAAVSRAPWEDIEHANLATVKKLALRLPAWELFGKPILGFGEASLGTIIAEAGDLSNYATHSKLWKRLGLAVFDGRRQGAPIVTTEEEWARHGYNPKRRSLIWNIGDALIKWNKGRYRKAYDRRKAYEIKRDPEMRPIVAHRRAQRYMEKLLIRDLWRAWRRIELPGGGRHVSAAVSVGPAGCAATGRSRKKARIR